MSVLVQYSADSTTKSPQIVSSIRLSRRIVVRIHLRYEVLEIDWLVSRRRLALRI